MWCFIHFKSTVNKICGVKIVICLLTYKYLKGASANP